MKNKIEKQKYYLWAEKLSKLYSWYMLVASIFGLFLGMEADYLSALFVSAVFFLTYIYKKHNWHGLIAARIIIGAIIQIEQLLTLTGIIDIIGIISILTLVRYRTTEENINKIKKNIKNNDN